MNTNGECEVAHPFLTAGSCPWCHRWINRGEPSAGDFNSNVTDQVWNIAAMIDALGHPDGGYRNAVARLFLSGGPPLPNSLPFLRKGMASPFTEVRRWIEATLQQIGLRLVAEELTFCESINESQPDDVVPRIILISAYFLKRELFPVIKQKRQSHIFWLIAHHPTCQTAGTPFCSLSPEEDDQVYDEAKAQWLRQVKEHHGNAYVMGNAASFCMRHEPLVSMELLQEAKKIAPGNFKCRLRLAHLYLLQRYGLPADARKIWAGKALSELEEAIDQCDLQTDFESSEL